MQHLVVHTSKVVAPTDDDWVVNGAGYRVSHKFGFGLLDAASLVAHAPTWRKIPNQRICVSTVRIHPQAVRMAPVYPIIIASSGCHGSKNEINFLEHVVAVVSLTSTNRGSMHIALTSPMGTRSVLLQPRMNDDSQDGIQNWPFMTVHSWGEKPQGKWAVHVAKTRRSVKAVLQSITLYLYGTKEDPTYTFHQ